MSRWIHILATTPSGKAQFVCRYCGRTSIAPDKTCRNLPNLSTGGASLHTRSGKTCEELEKERGALLAERERANHALEKALSATVASKLTRKAFHESYAKWMGAK